MFILHFASFDDKYEWLTNNLEDLRSPMAMNTSGYQEYLHQHAIGQLKSADNVEPGQRKHLVVLWFPLAAIY